MIRALGSGGGGKVLRRAGVPLDPAEGLGLGPPLLALSRCSTSPANSQLTPLQPGVLVWRHVHPARRPHLVGPVVVGEANSTTSTSLTLNCGTPRRRLVAKAVLSEPWPRVGNRR